MTSCKSGTIHVRNDHANLQFRINGVQLPDGPTGFGSILDASWIGSLSLVVGALPAEYGLRTVGLIDITTRTDLFNNTGQAGVYGGSQKTITPSVQEDGTFGSTCPTIPAPPSIAPCSGGASVCAGWPHLCGDGYQRGRRPSGKNASECQRE